MKRSLWLASVFGAVLIAMPFAAMAQDDVEVEFDAYSVQSEQMILLDGTVKSSVPPDVLAKLYDVMSLERFKRDLGTSDPNSDAIRQWCEDAVKGTQVRREQTDEVSDAQVTLKAKVERCSQVFKHNLMVAHQCVRKVPEKGDPYMSCKMDVSLDFTKFMAQIAQDNVNWGVDSAFGTKGQIVMNVSSTGNAGINKNTSEKEAVHLALMSGANGNGLTLKKMIREVRDFQQHAPIIGVKKGKAFSCLGRDTVELDLPFHVVYMAGDKEVKKGFVKARKLYDGCVETPAQTKEIAKGKKIVNKPMESQIILGGKNVKPGYTLWEMPTIGMNVGAGLGITSSYAGIGAGKFRMWPALTIATDQNLAPKTGISEFYMFQDLRISAVAGGSLDDLEKWMQQNLLDISYDYMIMVQLDLGVKKRWFAGPMFFGLGAGLAISGNVFNSVADSGHDLTPMIYGLGGLGQIEIGAQLTPRYLMSLLLGYRLEYGFAGLYDGTDPLYEKTYGLSHGLLATLQVLYTL